jgi:hypothetical protein
MTFSHLVTAFFQKLQRSPELSHVCSGELSHLHDKDGVSPSYRSTRKR